MECKPVNLIHEEMNQTTGPNNIRLSGFLTLRVPSELQYALGTPYSGSVFPFWAFLQAVVDMVEQKLSTT
jgi:hypothetical protein